MPDSIDFRITYQVVCALIEELDRLPNIPPHLRAFRAELEVAKLDFTRAAKDAEER